MSDPKRYGFPDCECDATDEFYMEDKGMCELLDGGFVKWEDYAELKADFERIRKHRNTLIERLDKAIEDIDAKDKWQPIETAPKGIDIWVLAYFETEHGEKMVDCVCQWEDGTWTTTWDLHVNPTHWMPLPKPPTR